MGIVAAERQLSQNELNDQAAAAAAAAAGAEAGTSAAYAEFDAKSIFAFTQRLLRRRLMM